MLELHQLDWQLQSTEAVSKMLDAMHSSKATSSALSVQIETYDFWLVLLCGDLAIASIANGENLSTSHAALPAMKVIHLSISGPAYTAFWSEVVPPSSIRGKLSGVAACI